MHAQDARKILSELKENHSFVSADDEKTLDLISKMVAGKPKVEADRRFLENLRNRLLLEASAPAVSPWWKTWQSFAKFLSVPVALAGIAAIAGTLGFLDIGKQPERTREPAVRVTTVSTDADKAAPVAVVSDNGIPSDETARTPAGVATPKTNPLPSLKGTETMKTDAGTKPGNPQKGDVTDHTLESVDAGISNIVGDTAETAPADAPMADSMGFAAPMATTSPAGGNALKMGTPSNVAVTEYRYSFAGALPKLPTPLPVYERAPKSPLPTFPQAAGAGMTVSQDAENGYSTVMRDYEKWPETPCQGDSCGKALKESDVPADSVIVGIATDFAKEIGVDLTGYGTPSVDSSWKNALSQSSDPSFKIVPENLTVVFPRKVGWFEIWDDSGYPIGVTFIVNHPTKRVQQVIGVETSTISSASSVTAVEEAAVTARLSNGGSATAPASESGATVVEIPMARAKIGYSLQYAEKNGKWIEFYVPSVVFETDKVPKSWEYFRTRVVVPLADVTKK